MSETENAEFTSEASRVKEPDSDSDVVPSSPPPQFLSLDSSGDFEQTRKTDEILIEKLLQNLNEIDSSIHRKSEDLETLDITIHIVTFKTYEAQHDFRDRIKELKDEREKLLTSIENRSELSLTVNDLDRRVSDLEKELEEKIRSYNREKIDLQRKAEDVLFELDEDLLLMQERFKELNGELDVTKDTLYRAQVAILNQKYAPELQKLQEHLMHYEKLHLTGWKVENSEEKLSEILEEQGLHFTPSGALLTRTGSRITFQDAHEKGYFKDVGVSLDRIFQFFKEREHQQRILDQVGTAPDSGGGYSEGTSVESKMSSEDVKYLKQYVGKPLTLALAEIIAKQPRDPIHYLGHYLFKYRYNQELEEIQKKEVDDLTRERKLLAQERWQRFVEGEARNAVIEMILRAENTAYQSELRRIEEEQALAEEGEEGEEYQEINELLDEARDKFE